MLFTGSHERRKKTTDAMTPTPKPIPLYKLVRLNLNTSAKAYDLTKRSATSLKVVTERVVSGGKRLTAPVILEKIKIK